jgi:uncharacterized paraquat-inducible protein A
MSAVKIQWRCDHAIEVPRAEMPTSPICPQCGERIVKQVSGATPKFKGTCSGPLVVSQ